MPAAPQLLGRAEELDSALSQVLTGRDVVVEGDGGMGKTSIRLAAAASARAHGFTVVSAADLSPTDLQTGVLVLDDLETMTPAQVARLREAQSLGPVRFLLTRRPPRPFSSSVEHLHETLVTDATVIPLRPLTAAQNGLLVDEQLRRGGLRAEPSSADRTWVWATSAGFPRLAVLLVHDADEAAEEEGTLARFSRRTIVAASDIVAALPAPLQALAGQLVPLVGIRFSRLMRSFDRVELGLLAESHVISDIGGRLCIAPPLQTALRLQKESTDLSGPTREIIADVCASVDVDASCSEAELMIAADALATDAHLREMISEKTQLMVTTNAMWFARRRGETEAAAALARRIMTTHPDLNDSSVRMIARNEPDDLDRFAQYVADLSPAVSGEDLFLWAHCLQLPLTTTAPGAADLLDRIEGRVPAALAPRVRALAETLRAAELLEDGDEEDAAALAAGIAADPSAGDVARLRALSVLSAVHALALDGRSLTESTDRLIALIRSLTHVTAMDGDLSRRQANDALLVLALSYVAIGLEPPEQLRTLIEDLLADALRFADPAGVVSLVVCRMFASAARGDHAELAGLRRFLRRKRQTELSQWALHRFSGEPQVTPIPLLTGRFVTFALTAGHVLTEDAQYGPDALSDGADALGDSPLGRVVRRYVASIDGTAAPASDPGVPEPIPGSGPAAFEDYVTGVRHHDAGALRRASEVFVSRGLPEHAQRALDALSPLVVGDAAEERAVRLKQRHVRSLLRARQATQQTLTAREREVAMLAAGGLRNREIARQLFLSVRTVESHLYRAMRKLSVTRDALPMTLLAHVEDD
ncbi:helix-turn-helix transcriptional regulator [Microbacterium gorillae]|uniref:helix-turn-helix transcriptional regulator n=1 Tax=Microbacterium gorillae TaxID=1231063 RepID=UPI00058D5F21|nr:LuxR C-terminal-related transcriptional regulator [Microbacterium gorillae]